MGWGYSRRKFAPFSRAVLALIAAGLVAGCFQPVYGDRSISGQSGVGEALRAVEVAPIAAQPNSLEAPLAVQIRNELLFSFTGGGAPSSASHRLTVQLLGQSNTVAIDSGSGLSQIENYSLRASYALTDLRTGRVVVTGQTSAAGGYDGAGQQRFARVSAQQDAARRAAKAVSEQIRTRLASYFVSGS